MQERYLDIVAAVDTEFARNRRLHGEKIHCRAGCADCCSQLFQITEIEAAYISQGMQTLEPQTREALRSRACEYTEARQKLVTEKGEQDLGERGTAHEHETAMAGHRIFLQDFRAGDVRRHQVGRELDAREVQFERARQGMHQQRLGQAGHAHEQAMATGKKRPQRRGDNILLPDDDLGDFGLEPFAERLSISAARWSTEYAGGCPGNGRHNGCATASDPH